jgi:hypothetical protein
MEIYRKTAAETCYGLFIRVNPQIISRTPRRIIQALGGRKKAHTVTMPKTRRTNPISLVP